MARKKILTLRKGYEGPRWNSGDNPPPWDDLDDLGKKFLRDKAKLEEQFEIISNSDLAPQHKKDQLLALRIETMQLQEDYKRIVAEKQDLFHVEFLQEIAYFQKMAEALRQQEEQLRSIRLEAASVDTTSVANIAEDKKRAFEKVKMEYVEELNFQIEQAEHQRREIMRNRIGIE